MSTCLEVTPATKDDQLLRNFCVQRNEKQRWLELTRRAFDHIDVDSDGKVSVDDLIMAFEDRIPAGTFTS